MAQKTIGISDSVISNNAGDVLITYSLGSCLGLSIYDPDTGTGALIHCLLPLSQVDPEKAKKNPDMFVETGVTNILAKLVAKGIKKKNLIIKAAGCGENIKSANSFEIGKRNFTVLRKILWKNGLPLKAKDIGGSKPRTMSLDIKTGNTTIKSGAQNYKI